MMTSLGDAWRWYQSVREQSLTMRQLGRRHWEKLPWDGDLGRDNRLRQLKATEIDRRSGDVLQELDDLCVLLLFSVFEALVRGRVLADVRAVLPNPGHPALELAIGELCDSLEQGSFARVLEPFKKKDPALVEEVSQVRRYRNWVAHGRRGTVREKVQPRMAYERLQRFLDTMVSPLQEP